MTMLNEVIMADSATSGYLDLSKNDAPAVKNSTIVGITQLSNHSFPLNSSMDPMDVSRFAIQDMGTHNNSYLDEDIPRFTNSSIIVCALFGVIFLLSLVGNLITLVHMLRIPRRRRNTIQTLILHLSTADLFVAFFCVLSDGIWGATVQWLAGNVMCKVMKFLQLFSLYLSTYIIVIISIDRCFAIKDPMSRNNAPIRVRNMIIAAYIMGAAFSFPQLLIFRKARGPYIEDFYQCVTYGAYTEEWQEKVYATASMLLLFLAPLVTMATCYLLIFCTIAKKSKTYQESNPATAKCCKRICLLDVCKLNCLSSNHVRGENYTMTDLNSSVEEEQTNIMLRGPVRSQLLRRAKSKSLRMTLVIVLFFTLWWLPYWICFVGFVYFGWDDPEKFDASLHSWIFFFGISNPVVNPIIYGAFHFCKRKRKTSVIKKPKTDSTAETPASIRKGTDRPQSAHQLPGTNGLLRLNSTNHAAQTRDGGNCDIYQFSTAAKDPNYIVVVDNRCQRSYLVCNHY